MDYSAANTGLWSPIVQIAIVAAIILLANVLRRKVSFIRNAMIPTAVLAGFIMLFGKFLGIIQVNVEFFEMLTYHCIAVGFIAMSLRTPDNEDAVKGEHVGLKSGAIIVSSYMVQGTIGLMISIGLAFTIKPDMFKAAGLLLPMGFGQGPGQANNIGATYEALGFAGGQSFGLAIAAIGYICACVVGVFYINYLIKKGSLKKINHDEISGSVTIDTFQGDNEIPVAESLDKLSVQMALILVVYGLTYLFTWGVTSGISAISADLAATVNSLLWGFNFIIGSALAIGTRVVLKHLRKAKLMNRQYQNNYLLSRFSGLAFDVMIVAGLACIEMEDLKGLWLPFILMSILGAIGTLVHLQFICKKVYKGYYYEGLVSMFGMMTGTISSGVLLLRELDPQMKTPAGNNMVLGSSFAILFGFPLLVLVGLAPKSTLFAFLTVAILIVYYFILIGIALSGKNKKQN
ncbi:MAG: hypothetical protein IKU44_04655 [Firmicutes bacterium]|nr:hypothetical protein [Bacillota bacterium]